MSDVAYKETLERALTARSAVKDALGERVVDVGRRADRLGPTSSSPYRDAVAAMEQSQ